MTSRLYIQKRGPSGGADVEYSAFTGRKGIPFFDDGASTIELKMQAGDGQAAQGSFKLTDPDAELPRADFDYNIPAHALVTWTEDGSGNERWLYRGRIAGAEGGRDVTLIDNEVTFDVQAVDGNSDLVGQAFTEAWARPEETDVARLLALQAYTLNGASSTADHFRETCQITVSTSHLTPNTGTVTMPAKKYLPGTQPRDVISDCAQTAGKVFGVVIHHTGGSHLCLLYVSDDDHSTYASAAKISDNLADWDPTDPSTPVWEPNWQAGAATLYEAQSLLSGLVLTYGTESAAFAEYSANVEAYDYWVDSTSDGRSTTSSQTTARAAGMLETYRQTHVTHRVSVIVQADQTILLAAGMSIQIKAAAALGGQYLDSYQTRRIVGLSWEPRIDGTYWAHMDLDRPQLLVGPSTGRAIQPPLATIPSTATTDWLWTFEEDAYDTTDTYEGGPRWAAGYIWASNLQPSAGVGTLTGGTVDLVAGTYHFRAIIRSRNSVLKGIRVLGSGGATLASSGEVVGEAATEVTFDFTVAAPDAASGIQFETYSSTSGHNTEIHEVEISHGTATSGFTGTPPPPASTDSVGTIGTSSIYSPIDHQHPAQDAEVTQIVDEGDYFDGGNVEDALQELAGSILAGELGDHSDVDLSSPVEGDILYFDGGAWINFAGHWEAVTDGEDVFVWEGDDLVHEWSL